MTNLTVMDFDPDWSIKEIIDKHKKHNKNKQYCIICGKFIRKTFVTYELNHKVHLRRYHQK